MAGIIRSILGGICFLLAAGQISAGDTEIFPILARIKIEEVHGLTRQLEYVELSLQIPLGKQENVSLQFVAENEQSGEKIPCQIIKQQSFEQENIVLLSLIFPVSIEANDQALFIVRSEQSRPVPQTDLSITGEGLDLIIDNNFYKADLTQSDQSEAKSHHSGQLRELMIKMGYDILLFRTENRMHWAPNFQKKGNDGYETIAGWEHPDYYKLNSGPYLILTERRDKAAAHEEILLTANYYFYAGLPYFRFFSSMEFMEDAWITLLRNDEMTMDSLFTHVAAERLNGEILDLSFAERHEVLKKSPIENEAAWLCFYHADKGYAFGSIRLKYDNTNKQGFKSPTHLPHTKISNGAGGGKYWNRRLIDEHPVFVKEGSRYVEENAYIVFSIKDHNKFEEIVHWAERLRHPLQVTFQNSSLLH